MPPEVIPNPYEVLGITKGCSEKDIQKAYKVQCLKWHPDKHLDNKEEAQRRFIAAKEAFKFLFDKEKRAEYDNKADRQKAKEEKQKNRMEQADTNRKKFINELERREREFSERGKDYRPSKSAQESDEKYKEQQRKEQEAHVRATFEEIRKQLEKEVSEEIQAQHERHRHQHKHEEHDDSAKLQVKWTPGSDDEDYDESQLRLIFEEYGTIEEVSTIIKSKKGHKMCILEFAKGATLWGAETESGVGGPEITAKWIVPPKDVEVKETVKEKAPGADIAAMSFEELQASILGDMEPPPEKKTKKWNEEDE